MEKNKQYKYIKDKDVQLSDRTFFNRLRMLL